jgi:hypothetical protein
LALAINGEASSIVLLAAAAQREMSVRTMPTRQRDDAVCMREL